MNAIDTILERLYADGTVATSETVEAALREAMAAGAEQVRMDTAEGLLALLFALRPSDDEVGQSWVLKIASTALARAILGSIGPRTDPEPMLKIALEDVRTSVVAAQSAAVRTTLSRGPRRMQ